MCERVPITTDNDIPVTKYINIFTCVLFLSSLVCRYNAESIKVLKYNIAKK